jgi:hypothetical protein
VRADSLDEALIPGIEFAAQPVGQRQVVGVVGGGQGETGGQSEGAAVQPAIAHQVQRQGEGRLQCQLDRCDADQAVVVIAVEGVAYLVEKQRRGRDFALVRRPAVPEGLTVTSWGSATRRITRLASTQVQELLIPLLPDLPEDLVRWG